jgi:hypothetical protein
LFPGILLLATIPYSICNYFFEFTTLPFQGRTREMVYGYSQKAVKNVEEERFDISGTPIVLPYGRYVD